eukprot:symbB.v1.2.029710.t1/scaffold3285.1/size59764/4
MASAEGVTEVRPKLYLASRDAAINTKSLAILRISHILSVGTEFPARLGNPALDEKQVKKRKMDGRSSAGRLYLQDGGKKDPFVRLFLPVEDASSQDPSCSYFWLLRPSEMEATNLSPVSPQDLAQHFDETRLFISEGLASGKVLVHCTEGRSRSVAILVAFLMQKEKISLGKALLSIKEKRPEIDLKPGFLDQLRSLEEELQVAPASPQTLEAAGALKKELAEVNPKVFMEISFDGTSVGRIEFELYSDVVPETCENFRCLCTGERGRGQSGKRLTYLGAVFHCVIPGFVAIGGDITQGDGTGGESIYGYSFKDENFEVKHDSEGILSMANSGPDSNGSQFLICFAASPKLDGKNVAFGKALSTDVLKLIEACGSEAGDVSKRITILDCGEVQQPGRQVKRLKRSQSAGDAAVVMVLQLLRKHKDCKKASSWREECISCSKDEAQQLLENFRQVLCKMDGTQRRSKFEELAREHSDCKSAKKGGLLDPFERGMMSKGFENAAFALKPGELSEIFSTKQGEHLLLRI